MKKRSIVCSIHVKCDVNSNMSDSFQAEGEIQFLYDSLKSTFQKSTSDNTTLKSAPSTTSSEDTPDAIPPAPQVPTPAPPEPPAHHPREPRPLPPPRERSTRTAKPTVKATNNPELNKLLKRPNQSNTVPFPVDNEDAEPVISSNAGGVTEDDNAEPNETANIASGEEPKTHQQAMQSPDFAEWEAAEHYELDMINCLGTYKLVRLPKDCKPIGLQMGLQNQARQSWQHHCIQSTPCCPRLLPETRH